MHAREARVLRIALTSVAGLGLAAGIAFSLRWSPRPVVAPTTTPVVEQATHASGHAEAVANPLAELRHQDRSLAAHSDELLHVLAALGSRLDAIEDRLDSLPHGGPAPRTLATNAREVSDAPWSGEDLEEVEDRIESERQFLEQQLAEEPRDGSWSGSAESEIGEAVRELEAEGLVLETARCASSFCRVELALANDIPVEESARAVQMLSPWGSEWYSRVDPHTGTAVVYLAREDHDLPQIDVGALR